MLLALAVGALLSLFSRDARSQADPVTTRLLLGEAALELSPTDSQAIRIALADSARTIILTVLARDARRWSDSLTLVVRLRPRSRRVPQEWRVILEEPGLEAGSMSVTRRDGETGSAWSLFVADKDFQSVRIPLEPDEVRALVAAMRRNVAAVLPPAARKKRAQRIPAGVPSIRRN